MPFCRHCGVEHAGSDRFCPSCGRPVGDVSALTHVPGSGSGPDGQKRGVTDVFGHAMGALWARRVWRLALTAGAATAIQAAAAVGALLLVAYATFSTVDPNRILRTSCFQQRRFQPSGSFTIRHGCDPFRLRADPGGLVAGGIAAVLIAVAVFVLTTVAFYRRCDVDAGTAQPRSILPGPGACFRAIYRVFGWWLVGSAGFGLLIAAAVIPLTVTAGATAGGARALLLLGEIAALAWLGIWWVVPFCVRVYLAGLRMVIDDRQLVTAYEPMRALRRGQAWGYVGLALVLAIGVSVVSGIVGQIVGSLPAGNWVSQFVFTVVSTLVTGVFAVAMMRNVAGELPPPASRGQPAGYEYQAGGSEPGAGGSAA